MKRILDTINSCQNPFDLEIIPEELINIITSLRATTDVSVGLNSFLNMGKLKHENFMNDKLITSTKSKWFWTPESRLKIPTFANMKKSNISMIFFHYLGINSSQEGDTV